jgi:muramoyltetrapeptide carboxypeptidase
VLCAGGGHSTGQLLRHLDFGLIADNPKPFVGFSEITVLHAAIGREARLVTLWGPMFVQLATATTFTRESMLRALTTSAPRVSSIQIAPPARTIVEGLRRATTGLALCQRRATIRRRACISENRRLGSSRRARGPS